MTPFPLTIHPSGDYDLARSAASAARGGVVRLAFGLDGDLEQQVGVELQQDADGVHAVVHGAADPDAVRTQVARMLGLDHDARGFVEIGRHDPVIRRLQVAAPGVRPLLNASPYEAALCSVLGTGRPAWQTARVRAALASAAGRRFRLAGDLVAALPSPSRLLRLGAFPGVEVARLERLHAVAHAAAHGLFDIDRLRALGPDDAIEEVRRAPGIGADEAALIVAGSLGCADVLPLEDNTVRALVGALHGFTGPISQPHLVELAEGWRPWRSWAASLVRTVGPRLLGDSTVPRSA